MMKKVFLCLLGVVSLAGCLEPTATDENGTVADDSGVICGFVFNIETDAEINGAKVTLSPGDVTSKTGSNGYFEFDDLKSGTYKVTATADGYDGIYRQLTIKPGREYVCDFPLRAIYNASAEVSPLEGLDFGRGKSTLAVTLKAHNGTLAYHAELEGNPSWVSLEKNDGTIPDYEKTSQVEYLKLTVDRDAMKTDEATCYLVIMAGRKEFRVKVTARQNAVNDYSSATVISCDSRIDAKIISCNWSGTSVVFNYSLTNTGLGDISKFSLGSSSYTTIYDDKGNEYTYWYITFRDSSTDSNSYKTIITRFPEGPECKGSITLKNVPSDVKNITYLLHAYIHYGTPLSGDRISFKNVPVYD